LTWAYGLPMHQNSINNAEISRQMSLISQPDVVIFDRKSRNEFQSLVAKIEKVGSADLFFLNGSAGLQHIMKGRGLYTLGPTFTVDGTFVTSDINFNRITGQPLDRVSVGLIKVSPNSNVQEVKAQLQAMFSNRAHVFLKSEFIENERRYYSEKTPIGYLVGVGLVMGIVVGIVFIHQALHNVIEDHMNEYAVMRTMGYRQSFFIMLTSSITFLFTMIAFLPSLAIALLINNMVTQSIQLQVALNLPDLILVLLILFVMGGVATTLAIRKLEKANPVDLFL